MITEIRRFRLDCDRCTVARVIEAADLHEAIEEAENLGWRHVTGYGSPEPQWECGQHDYMRGASR